MNAGIRAQVEEFRQRGIVTVSNRVTAQKALHTFDGLFHHGYRFDHVNLVAGLRVIAARDTHADLTAVHALRQRREGIGGIHWISEIRHQNRSAELDRHFRSDRGQENTNIPVTEIVVDPKL